MRTTVFRLHVKSRAYGSTEQRRAKNKSHRIRLGSTSSFLQVNTTNVFYLYGLFCFLSFLTLPTPTYVQTILYSRGLLVVIFLMVGSTRIVSGSTFAFNGDIAFYGTGVIGYLLTGAATMTLFVPPVSYTGFWPLPRVPKNVLLSL